MRSNAGRLVTTVPSRSSTHPAFMPQSPKGKSRMTQPVSSRRRRRGLLGALLGLTVVTLGAGVFSLAIFTDSAASSGSFATGTIDITSNPTVAFNVSNMMPGDTNTQALTIANAGTATLRYAMVSAATNVLGSTLQLEIKTLGT